jgi:hypothetical protein
MTEKKRPSATTIRLAEQDREAIAAIKDYYGVTSDNEAIRLALREVHRQVKRQALPPHSNKERGLYPHG